MSEAHKSQYVQSQSFDTIGVIADLHTDEGRSLAACVMNQTRDKHFQQIVGMAQNLGKGYVVAAGRFNSKGLFCTTCDDEANLRMCFEMANARMDEIGSKTTQWMILPVSLGQILAGKEVTQ